MSTSGRPSRMPCETARPWQSLCARRHSPRHDAGTRNQTRIRDVRFLVDKPNEGVIMISMMNEAQIKTAARKVARRAQLLRNKGHHAEADRMVREAMEN